MNRITHACGYFIKKTDRMLLCLCLLASGIGITLLMGIYESGYIKPRVVTVQIQATLLGVLGACIISLFDYRTLAKLWKLYVPASTALVALTYVFGKQRYTYIDDKAWLEIPWIRLQFQPSEILKLALVLSLALHLERARESINEPKTLLFLCLHGAVPTLMVIAQGDHGSAMVFVALFCCMLFAAGLSLRIVAAVACISCASSPLLWFFVLDNDKRQRILNVWGPSGDSLAAEGYQQARGLMAIGSGQIWGKGIFTGEHQYIPEMYNDFIFAFAGEAMGFIGCCAIIVLLALLCLRLLLDARQAKDPLGRYICVGVFGILSFQALWGIGMCLSLLPVTGLTLPFFSAGGTSVVMSYAAIGLAMSVHRHSAIGLFDEKT